MMICGSYMFEFTISKDMEKEKNNNDKRRVLAFLVTLIVKELKISVQYGRVVTTLNIITR